MKLPAEDKDPKVYTAYLFFLLLGIPIISIFGMLSSTQPTPLWSVASIPLSLLFFIPILPRGYKNAMKKKELSPVWRLVALAFGMSVVSIFIYMALTRSLPLILMPLSNTQFEKVMTIESIKNGGRRACVSGTKIVVVDFEKQLRAPMCLSRGAGDRYKVGQRVTVKGNSSWLGFTFDSIHPH